MITRRHIAAAFLFLSITPAFAEEAMGVRELNSIMNERERANGQRFDAQEKAVAAALAAAKEAVVKAEAAAEKRFDAVNEFRATLADQQKTLMPRLESEIKFKGLDDRLKSLEDQKTKAAGQSEGTAWLWGILIGVGGLLGGVTTAVVAFRKTSIRPS